MKKSVIVVISLVFISMLFGCKTSGKDILKKRIARMQESSGNPVTLEDIEKGIKEFYDDAEEISEKNAQIGIWYKIAGLKYLDKKLYGKALECFENALQYYPDNANLYYYVGTCAGYMGNASLDFNGTGDYEKMENYYALSEKAYLRALQIDDRYAYALYGIGILYIYQLNEPDKAIGYLEKLLTIDTKNINGMIALANAYYAAGIYDKSADMFDKIIATTKSDALKKTAQENKKQVLDEAYNN